MAPIPKPEPRKRAKAREKRQERKVVSEVRDIVSARDGLCRLLGGPFGKCTTIQEWAHLGAHRRFLTRGQAPEERHTTAGSLMLCGGPGGGHHHAYDKGTGEKRIWIEPMTDRGADGPLQVRRGTTVYREPDDWPDCARIFTSTRAAVNNQEREDT